MKPDRNPVASHQIYLVTVLGLCVSERVERGVGNHPAPCRIRISNYFCLGTYKESKLSIYSSPPNSTQSGSSDFPVTATLVESSVYSSHTHCLSSSERSPP